MSGGRASTCRPMLDRFGRRTVSSVSVERATTATLAGLRQSRAQWQAVQRGVNLLLPLLLLVVAISAFQARPGPGLAGEGLVVSIALGGFVYGALGTRSTQRSVVAVWLVVLLVASSAVLMWAQPDGPGAAGVFVGVVFLARRLPVRAAIPLSVATFIGLAVIAEVTGRGPGVLLLGMLGAFLGMRFLATRLGEANEQAEHLLVELEERRAAEALAAQLAERQRLAREMHDVLAHSLSGLALQLEGARMLATANPVDPRLPEVIDRAHHLARAGLEEAHGAIGMLRDAELPGPERLPDLATQFEHDRGIPCAFTVSGSQHELGSEARLALYRVAQEALTNIAKHARPQRVELHLAYEARVTRLTVEDFASAGGDPPAPSGEPGYGLTGMRERAELLGGTLTATTTPRGFRVELSVPA